MITIKNLVKDYPLINYKKILLGGVFKNKISFFRALDNISFEVSKGEVVGIIGDNGAGKTTLLKILSGVSLPTSGNVVVKGRVSAILGASIGLIPELNGRENIARNLMIQGLSSRLIKKWEEYIIDFSELEDVIGHPVKTYSSGMAAKLAFSIATIDANNILLIDELLSAGDEYFQGKSFHRIKELCNSGRTVVIVSHNLSYIERLCDRAIWLERGRIEQIGDAHQIVISYYGKNLLQAEEVYPREYGYIKSVSVSFSNGEIIVDSCVERKKSAVQLDYQVAVHDSKLGVLSSLANTSWSKVRLPSGIGQVRVLMRCGIAQGLCKGLVGTLLLRSSQDAKGTVKEDAWGWDNNKHINFLNPYNTRWNGINGIKAYIQYPLRWRKCA